MPPDITPPKKDVKEPHQLIVHEGQQLSKLVDDFTKRFIESTTPEQKREDTRNSVTRQIISLYVICVAVIVAVALALIVFGHGDYLASVKTVVEFLNMLVLPIITLVLGFYFGSEKK